MKYLVLIFLYLLTLPPLVGQQLADTSYHPSIHRAAYPMNEGPIVWIDEGHQNFHTKDGRYAPFAKLVARDGYRVEGYPGKFQMERLSQGRILVISNALNEANIGNWTLPTPSAFSQDEIEIIKKWVEDGGRLFLIADHMPMAGAAADLASAFGFTFSNGFAMNDQGNGFFVFDKKDGSLASHKIIDGRNAQENIDQVASFTGQVFEVPDEAEIILRVNSEGTNYLPDTAWQFHSKTPTSEVFGKIQGAVMNYGKGKLAVFGEAGMFTAQIAGPQKRRFGMNSEVGKQNYQLLLNIIHWLDDLL